MKVIKKVLWGIIAALTVVAFTGCAPEVGQNGDLITYSTAKKKGSIDYENDTGDRVRAFKLLKTKHYDANCTINYESTDDAGLMGFVFGFEEVEDENEDTVYNFAVAAIRPSSGFYVSYFKNVGPDYLESGSNFADKNGVAIGNKGCLATEKQITPVSGTYNANVKKNNVVISVESTYKADNDNGDLKVAIYEYAEDLFDDDGEIAEGKTALWSGTISASDLGNKEAKQYYCGLYANIFKDKTLTGSWNLSGITGEGEIEE